MLTAFLLANNAFSVEFFSALVSIVGFPLTLVFPCSTLVFPCSINHDGLKTRGREQDSVDSLGACLASKNN